VAEALRALTARRIRREPMAYVVGEREFWGLPFKVSPAVLVPRPDSETLIEAALALMVPDVVAMRFMDAGIFGDLWVSRSGYTGEDGFEMLWYADNGSIAGRHPPITTSIMKGSLKGASSTPNTPRHHPEFPLLAKSNKGSYS
jgi:hypothetical protein